MPDGRRVDAALTLCCRPQVDLVHDEWRKEYLRTYSTCVRASLCACSPCSPWFSIHWSTDNCSPGPLSVSYKFDDGVKITVDAVGILLDVAESERCEMARCRAADDGREPVISVDVKEGSARDCDGGRIDRAMATSGGSVWSNDGGGSKRAQA